jgi:hypothetical protein
MRPLPESIPARAAALLKMLDLCIPHRCPGAGEDAEAVQRYAGKRELVDLLLSRLEGDIEKERNDEPMMNWMGDNHYV